MTEYIERMSAIATACKGCNKEFSNEPCEPSECHIQQGLFHIPAADVVEVVRCKDCRKWFPYNGGGSHDCPFCGYPEEDDFCFCGERRSENEKVR